MNNTEITLEIVKIAIVVIGAGFTYFKFFREGSHRQRIEFDIDLVDLGFHGDSRIIEVGVLAENKGNVEQRFSDLRVRLRGLGPTDTLVEVKGHEPHLAFPNQLHTASLVAERMGYFFVRPNVKQRFPLTLQIPREYSHLLVRATFKYRGTNDLHIAERSFALRNP